MRPVKSWPRLYKISSKGKIQQWEIEVVDTARGMTIFTSWGYQNGEIQRAQEIVTEGKNVGKANETTPEQQAVSQAESKWTKQQRLYWALSVEAASKMQEKSTRPMLAHKWQDHQAKLEGTEIIIQPKLDGMRCLAVRTQDRVDLTSRGQKPINTAPHVNARLKTLMSPGEIWDGELYNPDLTFEELMSLARPKKPAANYHRLQFHVFDAIADGGFLERAIPVMKRLKTEGCDFIVPVQYKYERYCENVIELELSRAEGMGYEGIMIRVPDSPYVHKKTNTLLKVKTFVDEEYKVVGCETGTKGTKKDGILEVFVMETPDGQEFRGPLLGTDDHKRQMWAEKESFLGQWATVKFQEKTKAGVPRFPKVKGVRPTADMS